MNQAAGGGGGTVRANHEAMLSAGDRLVSAAIGDGWDDLTDTAGRLGDAGGDLIDGIF